MMTIDENEEDPATNALRIFYTGLRQVPVLFPKGVTMCDLTINLQHSTFNIGNPWIDP